MTPEFQAIIPVLRIFDDAKAREFYVDFLGFEVIFEHRYQEDFPLYMEVKRGAVAFHLSAHHGDGAPGMNLLVRVPGVKAYQEELLAKQYGFARPGPPEDSGHGTLQFTVHDPFGNRLTFYENT